MTSGNSKLSMLKDNIFMLIEQVIGNLHTTLQDRIDSQGIYALTKLIDSFLKITEMEQLLCPKDERDKQTSISETDLALLILYQEKMKKMAPRAGLEPATKRLTAACSTTELPGNNE